MTPCRGDYAGWRRDGGTGESGARVARHGFPAKGAVAGCAHRGRPSCGAAGEATGFIRAVSCRGEIDQLPDEQILVVDDDVMARDLLVRFLSLRGYHVRTARDGREALRLIGESAPDLLILDLAMPEMNGVEVLRTLTARDYAGRTIILGGHQNDLFLAEAWALGPQEVLDKPIDLERALMAIQLVMVCREC